MMADSCCLLLAHFPFDQVLVASLSPLISWIQDEIKVFETSQVFRESNLIIDSQRCSPKRRLCASIAKAMNRIRIWRRRRPWPRLAASVSLGWFMPVFKTQDLKLGFILMHESIQSWTISSNTFSFGFAQTCWISNPTWVAYSSTSVSSSNFCSSSRLPWTPRWPPVSRGITALWVCPSFLTHYLYDNVVFKWEFVILSVFSRLLFLIQVGCPPSPLSLVSVRWPFSFQSQHFNNEYHSFQINELFGFKSHTILGWFISWFIYRPVGWF